MNGRHAVSPDIDNILDDSVINNNEEIIQMNMQQLNQPQQQKQCKFGDDELNDTIEIVESPMDSSRINNGPGLGKKDKTAADLKASPISIESQG